MSAADTIVLIHGMWMTPRCWEKWADRYTRAGYRVEAPAWPGLEVGVEAIRRDPSPLLNLGAAEIIDHLERYIRALPTPPIIIGHSYGGALTQVLLDRGLGAAGVAIQCTQVKGVYRIPITTFKSIWHILRNPANARGLGPMTREQFHYAFTNTLTRAESDAVYDRQYIPGAGRAIFQGALANFAPHSPLTVNFANGNRAPLLLVGGEFDNIMPPSVQRETLKRYRGSRAVTEYIECAGRPHETLGTEGWQRVADDVLGWAADQATHWTPPRGRLTRAYVAPLGNGPGRDGRGATTH